MRRRLAAVALALAASSAALAQALFPAPLHLTRQLDDALGGKRTSIEEYCEGNRIVTVRGPRVAIADYTRRELTEIDRSAGTYSVTPFEALAATAPRSKASAEAWRAEDGVSRVSRFRRSGDAAELEVEVDRSVAISRNALEALIGAGDPQIHTGQHDAIFSAAAPLRSAGARNDALTAAPYGLPVRQSLFEGGRVVAALRVVHVDDARVPPELLRIDRELRRTTPPRLRLAAAAAELDVLPRVPR